MDNANNSENTRSLNLTSIPMSNVDLALGEFERSYALGEPVSITWSVNDPLGLVDHYDILLDGVPVGTISGDPNTFDLTDLSEGNHTLIVSAVDSGGNSTQISVPVVVSGSSTSGTSPLGISWELLIIIAIVMAALILLGLFLWRRKKV